MAEPIPDSAIPRRIFRPDSFQEPVKESAIPRVIRHKDSRENKKEGIPQDSFDEILEIGWTKYREGLAAQAYSSFMSEHLLNIKALRELAAAIPEENKAAQEQESLNKVSKNAAVIDEMKQIFELLPETGDSFYPSFGANKLTAAGKDASQRYENAQKNKLPLSRFYIAAPTRNAPQLFNVLLDLLKSENAIEGVNLSLYLEQTDPRQGNDKPGLPAANPNNIIIYIPDSDPILMEKVTRCLKQSQELRPELWQLESWEEADTEEAIIRELMVPLSSQVGFVEMPTNQSFHTTTLLQMYPELFGARYGFSSHISTEVMAEKMQAWEAGEKDGFKVTFAGSDHRRKSMPALLFP